MVRNGTECRAPATLAGVGGWKALKRFPLWGRILVGDQSEALLTGSSAVSSQKTFLLHKRTLKEHVS